MLWEQEAVKHSSTSAAHQLQAANYFITEDHWVLSDCRKSDCLGVLCLLHEFWSKDFSWEFTHFYISVIFVSVLQHKEWARCSEMWEVGSSCSESYSFSSVIWDHAESKDKQPCRRAQDNLQEIWLSSLKSRYLFLCLMGYQSLSRHLYVLTETNMKKLVKVR